MFPLSVVALALLFCSYSAVRSSGDSDGGQTREKMMLYQLDPVRKGFVREFEVDPDRTLRVETKALQPPIFEIPGFLTLDECDYIINQALHQGLLPSGVNDEAYLKSLAHADEQEEEDDLELGEDAEEMDPLLEQRTTEIVFADLDANDDKSLDTEELLSVLNTDNAFLRHKDVLQMYAELGLDPDSDGRLTLEEFTALVFDDRLQDIEDWVWDQAGHGEHMIRESKQAWLGHPGPATDPVLAALQRRIVSLTHLPEEIVQWSEQLQVVQYETGGHFHAHYDSNEISSDMDCMMNGNSGRFCRFMTILYYLEDTVSGGETAFPIADNGTYSEKATKSETFDLSNHCHDANLYIKPEKGKAVMWYNHYVNTTTGWVGDLNHFSLHGGCEVIEGTKWIANNWIWVDNSYERQMRYLRDAQRETAGEERGPQTGEEKGTRPGEEPWQEHRHELEGTEEGTKEGTEEGTKEGTEERTKEGTEEGTKERTEEGTEEGTEKGTEEGTEEGTKEGTEEGTKEGTEEGTEERTEEGTEKGTPNEEDCETETMDSSGTKWGASGEEL